MLFTLLPFAEYLSFSLVDFNGNPSLLDYMCIYIYISIYIYLFIKGLKQEGTYFASLAMSHGDTQTYPSSEENGLPDPDSFASGGALKREAAEGGV